MLLTFSFLWRLFYKVFLRFYQILAFIAAYALWCHLLTKKLFTHIYILIAIDLFATMMVWQVLLISFCNLVLDYTFVWVNVTKLNDMIKISLTLSQSWTIQVGQYVNLCISSINVWFFLQSHLFMIAFWTEDNVSELFLLTNVKVDFIKKLLQYAWSYSDNLSDSDYCLVWFSEPHELIINLDNYSSVIMIAMGLNIAAQLFYLKKLIKDYNNCKV